MGEYREELHPRDEGGRWTAGNAEESVGESFAKPGFHADGSVTLLHGTSALNAEQILTKGFQPGNPRAMATMIEDHYGLPRGSVYHHVAFEFARNRQDLDRVWLTSSQRMTGEYAVPEVAQDALNAVWMMKNPRDSTVDLSKDVKAWEQRKETRQAWLKREGARLFRPAVLAVTMPFDTTVGKYAFGKELTLRQFQAHGGTLDDLGNASVPISVLRHAQIVRVK